MGRLLYQKPPVSASSAAPTGGSWLWTWLLFGLLVTLINVFFEAGTISEGTNLTSSNSSSGRDPVRGQRVLPPKHEEAPHDKVDEIANQKGGEKASNPKHDKSLSTWESLDPTLKKEKGPLLELVRDAGLLHSVDKETLQRLPSWSQVTALYGDKPKFHGLDTCQTFQKSPNVSWHFVSTAGTFNTGTNLISELLIANCHMPAHEALPAPYGGAGVRWQVIWGKHTPVDDEHFRLNHRTYNNSNIKAEFMFPAVMVRDPFKWMQSMCRHEYAATWKRDKGDETHCPNLVESSDNQKKPVNVNVKYAEFSRQHDSLVGFWNDFYSAYFAAKFPRLIVRFEDLVYHPRTVVKTVCECAGGKLKSENPSEFHYVTDSAKKGDAAHGAQSQRTSYLDALIRYGTKEGRYRGFREADLKYANAQLNRDFMNRLSYPLPENPAVDAGT